MRKQNSTKEWKNAQFSAISRKDNKSQAVIVQSLRPFIYDL
jgi:hypothetical protein